MNHPNIQGLAVLGAMSAGQVPYATAAGVFSTIATSSFMRGLMNDADASTLRTSIGLAIGTNVQAYDATLTSLALLGTAADKIAYTTGVDTWAESAITAAGRAILDDADASAQRTTLGLAIGTNVQAWDAQLDDIAALAVTDSNFIVGNGTNWVAETGATARTSMGLGTGNSPQFTNLTLTGNLTVQGTTTTVDSESVLLRSNYQNLNQDYTTAVPQTAGIVANYLPTATATTVNGNYTAGVDGVSDPTIVTTGSAIFAATDIVMISGSTSNDGLHEVQGHVGTTLTLKSTSSGISNRVEAFTLDQIVAGASDGAAITKVTVSVLRCGSDGAWESGSGSQTGITYSDLSSITSAVAIALGGNATPIEGAASTYAKSNHDHGYTPLSDGGLWGNITGSWDVYLRALRQRGVTAAKTGNYSILGNEGHVAGDATGGAFNLTLPDLATTKGIWIPISNTGSANNVTLLRAGSDTVGGATSFVITPGTNMWVYAPHFGTNWLIF